MVVVALGEPGTPVVCCWALAAIAVTRKAANITTKLRKSRSETFRVFHMGVVSSYFGFPEFHFVRKADGVVHRARSNARPEIKTQTCDRTNVEDLWVLRELVKVQVSVRRIY
jgi:hypothetical protein